MKLLAELYHKDIGLENKTNIKYTVRKSARAVLKNDKNEIALMFVSKHNYYKLPGGGIEENETILNALKREVKEEVGASICNIKEIGMIIEYRDNFEALQISYNYECETVGQITAPSFTKREQENGFEIHWYPINKAYELLINSNTDLYLAKFIVARDIKILEAVKS